MSCITEILKLKGDKEALVLLDDDNRDPWIAVEGGGNFKDYEYLIVLNTLGHRCGYVALPADHPANNAGVYINPWLPNIDPQLDYNKLDIDCHGGLTFGSASHGLKDLLSTPCLDNWIGFDCGHHYDLSDIDAYTKYFGEKYLDRIPALFKNQEKIKDNMKDCGIVQSIKTYDFAEKQCKSIIYQLIVMKEAA